QHHSKSGGSGAPSDRTTWHVERTSCGLAGCGSLSAFNDWVRRGIMPRPIPGTRKWDRKAIDAALDRISGLGSKIGSQLSPYDEWKASQNAGATQRHQQLNQKTR